MYFTQRIGGEHVDVSLLVPANLDPAFWKPTASDIAAFQTADLILFNGASYESWATMVTLPTAKIVDTSEKFRTSLIKIEDTVTHQHGPAGQHSDSDTAYTTWLDFQQARLMSSMIKDALTKLRPQMKSTFDQNYNDLASDLDSLDQSMRLLASDIGSRRLIASRPVYQYWARRYQLNTRSVAWEPNTELDEEKMSQLKSILAEFTATHMIWDREPIERSQRRITEENLRSVVFDPCSNRPASGDWLSVMQDNIANLGREFNN